MRRSTNFVLCRGISSFFENKKPGARCHLAIGEQRHCCHVRLAPASGFGTSTRAACPRNAARRAHEPRDAHPESGRRGRRRAPARRRAPRVHRGDAPRGWPRLQSLRRVGSPHHAVRGVRVRGGQDRQRAGRHPRRLTGRARARRGARARFRAPAPTRASSVSRQRPIRGHARFAASRLFFGARRRRSPVSEICHGDARGLRTRAVIASRSTRTACLTPPRPFSRSVSNDDRSPRRRLRRRNASPAR